MLKTLVLTCLLMMNISMYGQHKVVSQREVYDKIVKADIKHPEIVLKQAIVESGNFKYKRAIQQNNYLGLLRKKRLIWFPSIDSCLNFYKERVQGRYNGKENYYKFLKRIGYATDPKYKYKVHNTELDFIIE